MVEKRGTSFPALICGILESQIRPPGDAFPCMDSDSVVYFNENVENAAIQDQTLSGVAPKFAELEANIAGVVHGQRGIIRRLLAAMISGGHVLLEDFPGTGKTTLAKALAGSVSGLGFKRVQFTPDLLPSDILGVSILNPRTQEFDFQAGPVFTDVLLADEINRASPRTQSALLEAMAESQVTVEGVEQPMSDWFFVIATQNPVEFRGTYPLPEAQMDRFAMQLTLGYVDREKEVAILESQLGQHPVKNLKPCVTSDDLAALRASAESVRVSREIMAYMVDLVAATRDVPEVQLPGSPRAALSLMKCSRALAAFAGEEFVTPDHVKELAEDVVAHRLVIDPQARYSGVTGREVVREVLAALPVPA